MINKASQIINTFTNPCECRKECGTNQEVISTHTEAAIHTILNRHVRDISQHIQAALRENASYHDLLNLMPNPMPDALASYQAEYSENDLISADEAIKAHGAKMADGEYLFHGGHWSGSGDTYITTRPFSTSFLPEVAILNAKWHGKAFNAGRLDLMVVRVTRPKTKSYAYDRDSSHGYEYEVVFASGAALTRLSEKYVTEIKVSSDKGCERMIPAYLIEVEIS